MRKTEEDKIAEALWQWFTSHHPRLRPFLFHIPNGGLRNKVVAGKLKAQGTRKGVSDYLFMYRAGRYPGLWIELKTDAGRPSDEQLEFIASARAQGYAAVVAYGLEQAKNVIESWADGRVDDIRWMFRADTRSERRAMAKRAPG